MAKIAAPKRKGVPPPEEAPSTNLTKLSDSDPVAMNFRVPASFRKRMKQYAAEKNMSMVDLLVEAVDERMKQH